MTINTFYSGLFRPIAETDGCMVRFFYNTMSVDAGTLKVYARTEWTTSYTDGLTLLWLSTGNGIIGDFWQRADVALKSSKNFQGKLPVLIFHCTKFISMQL